MKRNFAIKILSFLMALIMLFSTITIGVSASSTTKRKIINVVFVLDNTGSMSDEIANVRNNLQIFTNYLDSFDEIDELRLALIKYEDITYDGIDSTVVYKSSSCSPWFSDVDELISTIKSIPLGNGGDNPETVYDGLGYLTCGSEVDDAVLFNYEAYKFAFVLTDNSPKTNNRFGITGMSDMVERLKSNGIYTSVVSPNSYKNTYSQLYNYAPDGGFLDEDGNPITGIWMNIYGNFSQNMIDFANTILSVVRPNEVDLSLATGTVYNFQSIAYLNELDVAKTVYTTSDSSIVQLSSTANNIGTALKKGNCTVTVTDGSNKLKINIQVTDEEITVPVQELKISTDIAVGVNQSLIITATVLPEDASEHGLLWYCDDESVIQIVKTEGNKCILKGIKSGTSKLTAVTKDGGYAGSTEITVSISEVVPVTGVSISDDVLNLSIGDTKTITGKIFPSNATNKGGYWYSTDSDVIKIISTTPNSCSIEMLSCGTAQIYFVSNEGGYSKSVTINGSHMIDYKNPTVIEEASCNKAGRRAYICEHCKAILDTEEFFLEHTPSEWIIDNPATCTANGSKHIICMECRETIQTGIIPALDHHFVHTKTVNATCTSDGYVLFTCDRDGCSATRKNVLSALGHTYGGDNICDRCGYTLPSAHEHSYSSSTVAPTCTTSGYTLYECSCGSSYKSDYIEPKGHRWDEGVDTVTKTCTSDGLKTYTCSVCHITKTEVIPAGHTWSETVITEPTCTTDGSKKRTCSFCNEVEYVNIPAGHVWDEGTIITEATCIQTGTKRCECQECHTTEVLEIPALGHRYVNGICQICNHKFIDDVSSNPEHPVYGMFFEVDDIQSAYGSDLINEYGVLLDFNPDAKLNKVAVYLTQDGTMWRRCIACTGTGIKYATYVPYLSYETDIKYTGLNSSEINTFSLSEGSDHIWRYSDYATIGVNLEDYKGNLLLSLYDIGQAGAETRLFDNLDEMIAWLKTSEPDAKYTDMSVESDEDSILTNSEITFEVKISDAENITAAAVDPKFNSDMFEYVGAEWVIGEAMLQDIDPNTNRAVSMWSGEGIDIGTSTSEVLYRFTLKAKETIGVSDVGCIVKLESADDTKEYSAIKTIEIIECSHENGYCSELDGSNHTFICPDCGFTATMIHTYDDNCDSECNDCGHIRTAPHNFETAWSSDGTMHWHECLDCHTHTAEETHTYTDACDSTCNICGYTRVAPHNFKTYWSNDSTEHWHECSGCGLHTDTESHIYSNNCDETCNECGYIRVAPHSYENVWSSDSDGHWHQCSECDSIADFSAHHYNEHGICTECQYYVPGHFVEPWGNQPTSADVEYLLYHIYFGNEQYPIYQETDYNNDGVTDISDAQYLLYYIFFPEDYPISK